MAKYIFFYSFLLLLSFVIMPNGSPSADRGNYDYKGESFHSVAQSTDTSLNTNEKWEGAEITVIEGDPDKDEKITFKIEMPDGFSLSPHFYNEAVRIDVLSGLLYIGSGDRVSRDNLAEIRPGGYADLPPEMSHYLFVEGATVIELRTVGPWHINHLNRNRN